MNVTIQAAQFPVLPSIDANLALMEEIIAQSNPGDLIVFPEGAVSGYSTDLAFFDGLDSSKVKEGLEFLHQLACTHRVQVWAGACYQEAGHWLNTAWGFTPDGEQFTYRKINLANHERGKFTPGDELPVFEVKMSGEVVKIGVQICRELRYPEQWGWLARQGAQLFLHLNNATGAARVQPVWKSHLVSRAAETQRFVVSVNNAHKEQNCPTLVVSPMGEVLGDVVSGEAVIVRVAIDISQVSNFHLSQCRSDIVRINYAKD
jgi:predicted amidohydrolase